MTHVSRLTSYILYKALPLLLSVVSTSLYAQTTFDGVVNTILDNNPALQSQQQEVIAQSLDDADANALADPTVDFARVWGRHGIGNKLQLDVSQSFEWPGVYGARSRAAQARQSLGEMQYLAERLDKSLEVRQLLIELIYVRNQMAVIDDLRQSFAALGTAIDKGVRGGELTVIDQRKMQIENFEIENDYATVKTREQQIITQLQSMTTATLDLAEITQYPLQSLDQLQSYLDEIPDDPAVKVQALAVDEALSVADVASKSRLPGFSVGYQHQAEMGDRFNGFTVGVNLPVFQGRKAKQAALERKDAAEYSQQSVVAQRTAEVNGTYTQLLLQRERIDTYNQVFGDKQYLSLLLKAYSGGQLSVIEYLSEVHYYHQTMLTYLDAEYNYHLSLTTLNRMRSAI